MSAMESISVGQDRGGPPCRFAFLKTKGRGHATRFPMLLMLSLSPLLAACVSTMYLLLSAQDAMLLIVRVESSRVETQPMA